MSNNNSFDDDEEFFDEDSEEANNNYNEYDDEGDDDQINGRRRGRGRGQGRERGGGQGGGGGQGRGRGRGRGKGDRPQIVGVPSVRGRGKHGTQDSRLRHVNNFVPGTAISNPNDNGIITIDEDDVSPMMPRELYAGSARAHASNNSTSTSATATIQPPNAPSAARGQQQQSVTSTAVASSAATMAPHEEDVDATDLGLSHRTQMILVMDTNKSSKNDDSITANFAKQLLDSVLSKEDRIIELIHAEKCHLVEDMAEALHAPFPVAKKGKRAGKYQYCEKLVDIWLVFKQVDSLIAEARGGTRSNPLKSFENIMAKMDRLADEKVEDNLNKFKCWKSDPMPIGEKDRRYLEGGGIHFEGGQYPYCPNPKCRHTLIDQPPGNAIVREQNRLANTAYLQQCEAFKLWKNGQGLQPICQITNTPLEKMPKPPTPLEPMLRCHCSQNRADPRAGLKCAVDCRVNNMQYELGKCPLCKCVCCAFIPLKKYDAIVTATTLGAVQQQNAQAESADWLNSHINVNRMQQRVSAEYYRIGIDLFF